MPTVTKKSTLPIVVSLLLGALFIISLITIWHQAKITSDMYIADDVAILASILKKIDQDSTILGFKFQKNNYIDYLQVRSFVGSEIGSMNLKIPQNWKGPYLRDNLMIQGRFYQIVETIEGYFIVPGDGVVLHNGKVIGKDIEFTYNTNITRMMKDPNFLQFQGQSLASPLEINKKPPLVDIEDVTVEE